MCGIVGVLSYAPVNQLIYDALLLLQHRGQDAAGIVTMQGTKCFMHKARGMVRDVFRTRNMRALPGLVGLGPGALPHRRQRLQRGGGAALLRERALRHRARAQRQPHQCRRR
jgi:glutamine phosphoribosylpyrophosphate amidotransferase